ncbi:hypothetical protein MKX03_022051 [Papaver bracteatum]|nr:hypothetical protein MKX03_022051 [Papaver bracteatum]
MAVPQSDSGNEDARNGFVPLSPKTTLVVDDSEAVRMIHSLHLRALEAVRLLESGMRFDVILKDYYMPEMNGAEATRRIRDMGIQSVILGVAAIDDDGEDIRENFVQSGLTDIFSVPLTRNMLIPYSTSP